MNRADWAVERLRLCHLSLVVLWPWRSKVTLLARGRRANLLLSKLSVFGRSLFFLPSPSFLGRCSLHGTLLFALLILLSHHGIPRLIAVALLLQLMLLLNLLRISIPRILPLIDG